MQRYHYIAATTSLSNYTRLESYWRYGRARVLVVVGRSVTLPCTWLCIQFSTDGATDKDMEKPHTKNVGLFMVCYEIRPCDLGVHEK
jgi:hypothetical protein